MHKITIASVANNLNSILHSLLFQFVKCQLMWKATFSIAISYFFTALSFHCRYSKPLKEDIKRKWHPQDFFCYIMVKGKYLKFTLQIKAKCHQTQIVSFYQTQVPTLDCLVPNCWGYYQTKISRDLFELCQDFKTEVCLSDWNWNFVDIIMLRFDDILMAKLNVFILLVGWVQCLGHLRLVQHNPFNNVYIATRTAENGNTRLKNGFAWDILWDIGQFSTRHDRKVEIEWADMM